MIDVIEGSYLRDILAQPVALRDSLAGFAVDPALGALLADAEVPVVLTGMGASLHALVPLELALSARGRRPVRQESGELFHHARGLLASGTLLVAVSQSGRSAEIVRLVEEVPGLRVVGVTNDATSPLALRSAAAVVTRAGKEATVSCKTYVSALAALAWVGAHLPGGDPARLRAAIASLAEAIESYLGSWRRHVEELATMLRGVNTLYFVGRGVSLATACTAGLVTKEAACVAAEGMSAAAFRHGPMEMARDDVFVLVFEGEGGTVALNRGLVEDVRRAGGRAALCGVGADTAALRLPEVSPGLSPIVEVLPVQMVTMALAALRGREAGTFRVAAKITATE
jgi:glucosamine--fructose-6-phosphate aminotransferase (isomerizing)